MHGTHCYSDHILVCGFPEEHIGYARKVYGGDVPLADRIPARVPAGTADSLLSIADALGIDRNSPDAIAQVVARIASAIR